MVKSGLIIGAITLVIGLGLSLLSPICTVCCVPLLGGLAGYLAGVFDKPGDNNAALKSGALAGAIGGAGGLLGQLIGGAINSTIMGAEGAADFLGQLGVPVPPEFADTYWLSVITSTCCFSLLDLFLMAALGAVGGLVWWQISGKKASEMIIDQPHNFS